jgi:Trypsin-co-occurring domain 1
MQPEGAVRVTQLIEFPLATGSSVLVEVTERLTGPVTRGLTGGDVTERAQQTFEEAVSRVRPAVKSVIAQLRSLAEAPDEITLSSASTCTRRRAHSSPQLARQPTSPSR